MYFKLRDAVNTHSCTCNFNYITSEKTTQPKVKYYECLLMAVIESFQLHQELRYL